jgi:hypothetical protein
MATYAHSIGLQVNAGHGLTLENTRAIAQLPEIVELNINTQHYRLCWQIALVRVQTVHGVQSRLCFYLIFAQLAQY